jgi:RNA polymerase primary sigma factor
MAQPASSVDWILKQSHRFPLLTAAEEITLARQVQNWQALLHVERPTSKQRAIIRKGIRARDRFFLSNIRLAVKVAGKYHKFAGSMALEDLIQEGLLGLDSAIVKFDPGLGYKFSTYSYWWIRQGITRAINKYSRIIHLPIGAPDAIRKSMDYMRDYCREHGKLPPLKEVAKACGVQEGTLTKYLNHNASVLSLDQPMAGSSDHSTYLELVADQSATQAQVNEVPVLSDLVMDAVATLPDNLQMIVKERYFSETRPTTYQKLGEELFVSRELARQMHDNALKSLRLKLGGLTGQECIQALQSAA